MRGPKPEQPWPAPALPDHESGRRHEPQHAHDEWKTQWLEPDERSVDRDEVRWQQRLPNIVHPNVARLREPRANRKLRERRRWFPNSLCTIARHKRRDTDEPRNHHEGQLLEPHCAIATIRESTAVLKTLQHPSIEYEQQQRQHDSNRVRQ